MKMWTTHQIDTMRKMRSEGINFMTISGEVGHSVNSCMKMAHKNFILKGNQPVIQQPEGPGFRKCMCCKKSFRSAGIGNRLCSECANRSVSNLDF